MSEEAKRKSDPGYTWAQLPTPVRPPLPTKLEVLKTWIANFGQTMTDSGMVTNNYWQPIGTHLCPIQRHHRRPLRPPLPPNRGRQSKLVLHTHYGQTATDTGMTAYMDYGPSTKAFKAPLAIRFESQKPSFKSQNRLSSHDSRASS